MIGLLKSRRFDDGTERRRKLRRRRRRRIRLRLLFGRINGICMGYFVYIWVLYWFVGLEYDMVWIYFVYWDICMEAMIEISCGFYRTTNSVGSREILISILAVCLSTASNEENHRKTRAM